MKKHISVLLIIYILIYSCSNSNQENALFDQSKIKESPRENTNQSLTLEPVELDSLETSFSCLTQIIDNHIYIVDARFGWLYILDTNGKKISTHLGMGEGPDQLGTGNVYHFSKINDGNFVFLGQDLYYEVFNKQFERIKKEMVIEIRGNSKSIDGGMKNMYMMSPVKPVVETYDNNLYFNLFTDFSDFVFSPDYFENFRVIGRINLDTDKFEEINGRMSPYYQQHPDLCHFTEVSFDIDESGNIYVCYEADPIIYKFSNDFTFIEGFGTDGKDMNTDYIGITDIKEYRKITEQQREQCGYYTYVKYVDEKKVLFRTYTKSNKVEKDGLQIYHNDTLIADVEVPKGFKVAGYIEPYFYSEVLTNEEAEELKLFKFKIDTL